MYPVLQNCPIFKHLNHNRLSELFGKIHFQVKKYGKSQIIALSDEICTNLHIILKGSVKGEMSDAAGKTIKIEDIKAPQTIASIFLFGQHNRFPVTVIANEPTEIMLIPKESVLKLFQMNRIILNNYLDIMSDRTYLLTEKMKFLTFRTIRGKIAHFLLTQPVNEKQEIYLDRTQQELADLFGVTRPSLARAFGDLDREGVIKADRRRIVLIEKDKLIDMIRQ